MALSERSTRRSKRATRHRKQVVRTSGSPLPPNRTPRPTSAPPGLIDRTLAVRNAAGRTGRHSVDWGAAGPGRGSALPPGPDFHFDSRRIDSRHRTRVSVPRIAASRSRGAGADGRQGAPGGGHGGLGFDASVFAVTSRASSLQARLTGTHHALPAFDSGSGVFDSASRIAVAGRRIVVAAAGAERSIRGPAAVPGRGLTRPAACSGRPYRQRRCRRAEADDDRASRTAPSDRGIGALGRVGIGCDRVSPSLRHGIRGKGSASPILGFRTGPANRARRATAVVTGSGGSASAFAPSRFGRWGPEKGGRPQPFQAFGSAPSARSPVS